MEYFGARYLEALPIDNLGTFYRQFYFLRRSLVTLDEFGAALNRLNEIKTRHDHVHTKGDRELKKRWNDAIKFFQNNKKRIALIRGQFGGHFPESVAREVIAKLTPGSTGVLELDIDHEAETAGVKLHFCTELLAIVLRLHEDNADPTEAELHATIREWFDFITVGWKHAVHAMSVVIAGYFLARFRKP